MLTSWYLFGRKTWLEYWEEVLAGRQVNNVYTLLLVARFYQDDNRTSFMHAARIRLHKGGGDA